MNKLIASFCNCTTGLTLLILGATYFFSTSFMSYHAQAISQSWADLETNLQQLILVMMKVMAGGYLSTGVFILCAQYLINKNHQRYLAHLILICGGIISLTSGYATILVRLHTPGRPPTLLAIIGACLVAGGYVFNLKMIKSGNAH